MKQNRPGRLFAFVSTYPRAIIVVALLLSALSLFYAKSSMTFLTGRDSLMPSNAPFQREYYAYRAEFGDQEDIVVVIESGDASQSLAFGDALYARLNKTPGAYRELFYPGGLPFFRKNGLLFMPLEEIQGLSKTLTLAAPVLKDLAAAPSVQTLFTSITGQIDSYLALPPDSAEARNKLKSLSFMLASLDTGFKGFDGKNSALSMDSFLKGSGSGKPSLLESVGKQQVITILPVKDETSFVPAEKAIKSIRAELAELLKKPEFKGVQAGLTGVPVLEYEEMATSQKDMETATFLSLGLTVLLLLVAFRGVLNVIAAMVSLLVAISLSLGFATLAVGHLNILSMAFAVMLIGLGVEYGIQVVLRYQEGLKAGLPHIEAIDGGITRNILAIIMAGATVALAFATFAMTDFKGIAELGIIAAGGIIFCVLCTFTVLPAILVLMAKWRKPKPAQTGKGSVSFAHPVLAALFGRPWPIIAATVALSLLCALALTRTGFDYNMMNLQAKGLDSVTYAYKLMRSRENSGYFGVAVAKDRSEALELTQRLEKLPAVDHVVSVLSFAPDGQEAKLAEIAALRRVLAEVKPVPYDENLSVMELPAVFEGFRDRVAKLKSALEGRKAGEAPAVAGFLQTLDKFFGSLEKEKDRNALGMLREFQGSMFAQFPAKIAELKSSLEAAPVTDSDVPQQLKSRFVGKTGKLLLQVAPKQEIFDREPLAEFIAQIRTVYPKVTGEPVNVFESMTILRDAYLRAFGYAFAGIALILLVTFRSVKFALLGLLPLLAGLLLMIGGMWLGGIRFNVANIIVMPLLLGVGVDSAIYIINRYRNEGETPLQVVTSSAGVGVLLNALTILFSFGALMVARHQGVFSIGAVMSIGMTAVVAAFLVFLPALLIIVEGKRR
ncbi:MMPL family transporter [Geobacter pelophilus]|uniref:MMPL family transporter n=1 Tax=Geoanaerobacter pelophilus TaxID=60036 RepID=A0AAW4LB43_9BACT|nr:MMPL family transporter [Geoanaerobacter pelophilus]